MRRLKIVFILGLLAAAVGAGNVIRTLLEYRKSDRLYETTEKQYTTINSGRQADGGPNAGSAGENTTSQVLPWYEQISVDLAGLQAINPDIIGWIYFENEDISYPILYSGDNEAYLRKTYTGEQTSAGSIFLDGESTSDFSDPHTLVYGHNMRNLSMFGKLKYYKTKKDYYKEHAYFQIITEEKIYRYQIFAYEEVSIYDRVYEVYGASPEGFAQLLEEFEKKSYEATGVPVTTEDKVMTLSTCSGEEQRMIVNAKRVDEYLIKM